MSSFFYYLVTFFESIVAVVGIRPFEQPRYDVVARLGGGVEIRDYASRVAAETGSAAGRGQAGDGAAFERLFRYITGHNHGREMIAMTAPVAISGRDIAMTVPVERDAGGTMRFFLPASTIKAGPPEPDDPRVRIVSIPGEKLAALRFSGSIGPEALAREEAILTGVLTKAGYKWAGEPVLLGYDPPFTLPFLRRNEVAVTLSPS